jgi:hypothetical protein
LSHHSDLPSDLSWDSSKAACPSGTSLQPYVRNCEACDRFKYCDADRGRPTHFLHLVLDHHTLCVPPVAGCSDVAHFVRVVSPRWQRLSNCL